MEASAYSLVLDEVSLIEVEEISAGLPPADVDVLRPTDDDETHGELATILVLTLTPMVLTAMSIWMLRNHAGETIEYKVKIRSHDGSEKEVYLRAVWEIEDGALRWWERRDSSFGCGRSRAGVGWPRSPERRNGIRRT